MPIWTRQQGPPFDFFGTVRLSFRKFFNVSKGSPLQFLDILQQTGISKAQRAPFQHCEIFQIEYFLS